MNKASPVLAVLLLVAVFYILIDITQHAMFDPDRVRVHAVRSPDYETDIPLLDKNSSVLFGYSVIKADWPDCRKVTSIYLQHAHTIGTSLQIIYNDDACVKQ